MKNRKFNIVHAPTSGEIEVNIDFDFILQYGEEQKTMKILIEEMATFWSGWEERLQENDGSYLNLFLKQLCQECITVAMDGSSCAGVISQFNNREGWLTLDGTQGIKLLRFSGMEIKIQEDYVIHEIPDRLILNKGT